MENKIPSRSGTETPDTSITTRHAPKLTLPFRYIITGIILLNAGILLLIFKPEILTESYIRNPLALTLAHIITLGFATSIILGAMHQLLPVLLETSLLSERLGRIYFWPYLIGIIGMFWSFLNDYRYIVIFTGIVSLTLFLFSANVIATLIKAKKFDYIVLHIIAGILFLLVTVLIGPTMGASIESSLITNPIAFIGAHFIFSAIGFFTIITIGFSYKLIPMFIFSHEFNTVYAKIAFLNIFTGTAGLGLTVLLLDNKIFEFIFLILLILGILFYLIQMRIIFKKRLRKKLDPVIATVVIAKVFLVVTILISCWILFYKPSFSVNHILFIMLITGWIGLYIIGMLHKIIPFLVWYNKYSSKIGVEKVPLTKDMINESLIPIIQFFWVGGIVSLSIGSFLLNKTIVQFSALALFCGIVLFSWNILNVFRK